MHGSGLILVLALALLRPGQPAGMDESTSPKHDYSGMRVCSIDPTWGIELTEPTHDTSGDLRVPKNLDPAFDVSVPCFRDSEPAEADIRLVA
jgi:hypothetical protein